MADFPTDLRCLSRNGAKAFAEVFNAIADKSRLMILSVLSANTEPCTAVQIQRLMGRVIEETTVTSHVRRLVSLGLLTRNENGVAINYEALSRVVDAIRSLSEPSQRVRS